MWPFIRALFDLAARLLAFGALITGLVLGGAFGVAPDYPRACWWLLVAGGLMYDTKEKS